MLKKMNLVGLFALLAVAVVLSGCATTPLSRAAASGDTVMVQQLLDAGADVNQKSLEGLTPLMWAAYKGEIESVKILLENGAETGGAYCDGDTMVEFSRKRGHLGIAELIESEPQRRKEKQAKAVGDQMISQLKTASINQLLQKYPLKNEFVVSALTDALVEAKLIQLPKFMLTASYEEKTAVQVALEKRLLQSAVELQQCNNEAQGYLEQDNNQKTLELRNLSTALISYQTVLKSIKAELENY